MDGRLRSALAVALDAEVTGASPVHGGDVAVAYRIELADGRRAFAKTHADPPAGFFSTTTATPSRLPPPTPDHRTCDAGGADVCSGRRGFAGVAATCDAGDADVCCGRRGFAGVVRNLRCG
jgi:hypothetical protein